jgi:calcineurin-like phosphoesterase family protein
MTFDTWFISDLHLGHEKLLGLAPDSRPFKTIEEHDEAIISNWNAVVKPQDRVWVLGDVSCGTRERKSEVVRMLKRCAGTKRLVLGNHDGSDYALWTDVFEAVHGVYADGTRQWVFSHVPVHPDCLGHRFQANIHGHLHTQRINDPRYINVSCEQVGFTPINRETVKKLLAKQQEMASYA